MKKRNLAFFLLLVFPQVLWAADTNKACFKQILTALKSSKVPFYMAGKESVWIGDEVIAFPSSSGNGVDVITSSGMRSSVSSDGQCLTSKVPPEFMASVERHLTPDHGMHATREEQKVVAIYKNGKKELLDQLSSCRSSSRYMSLYQNISAWKTYEDVVTDENRPGVQ